MEIFKKNITSEELNEQLKECMETSGGIKKHFPMRMYKMAKQQYEMNQKEQEIIDKMYKDARRKVKKVHVITDDLAIIKTFEEIFGDEEKTWYRTYVNGRIDSNVTDDFDMALIQLVCSKRNCEEATGWIGNMLNIKEEE